MPSIVDKYEQILAADPRSRIFVELAKALVDRGEHARAIDVCRRGLEHHPSSILGRVTWGRALLESGDTKGGMDQFEIAIALEPSSPYAYNHVGEALLRKGLFKEALPVLARAVELQPGDARVRRWLDDAKRRARGEPAAPAAPAEGRFELEDEVTEPYRPVTAGGAHLARPAAAAAQAHGGRANGDGGAVAAQGGRASGDGGAVAAQGGRANGDGGAVVAHGGRASGDGGAVAAHGAGANGDGGPVAAHAHGARPNRDGGAVAAHAHGARPNGDGGRAPHAGADGATASERSVVAGGSPGDGRRNTAVNGAAGAERAAAEAGGAPSGATSDDAAEASTRGVGPGATSSAGARARSGAGPAAASGIGPAATSGAGRGASGIAAGAGATPDDGTAKPPPLPPGATPVPGHDARSVLYMLPGDVRDVIGPAAPARAHRGEAAAAPHDPAEADRIAAQYERELREKLTAELPLASTFLDRHRRLFIATAVAVVLAAAGGAYLYLDARNSDLIARTAASRGRAGLARDTLGSLREANRLLTEARRRAQGDAEVASLAAQIAGVLAADFGDEEARAVAARLAEDPSAGDGAIAARWLVASTDAERKDAEAEVLDSRPSSAPLVQAIAGRVLLRRGEREGGKGRLDIAARSNPPLLRAIADLGDLALASGDAEGALAIYASALAAHPTHPRSVVGAAEARLVLERDLVLARKDLAAVDADAASAPPRDVRPRFEIVYARVLAATGEPAQAAARLQKASESLGESAAIAAALAELQLSLRAWDKAEAAAQRAVRLEPREAGHRVLLARARIGRGRYREALSATEGQEGRAVRIQRATARLRLGQIAHAREELERTAKDGKMPAEAAVWYALADVASGKADRALPLLEKLSASPSPPPLAHLALGRALEAKGDRAAAEEAYRTAILREPNAPEGHLALGRLLLASDRAKDAAPSLERAVKLDPADLDAHRALGEARLAAGEPSAARADLDFVLMASPRDAGAYALLSAAWLAEGQASEARRAAERAVELQPRNASIRLAAAKASLAAGDRPAARKHAEKALKSGASGDAAAEARRIVEETGGNVAMRRGARASR